jgi:hypothetical protein
MPQPLGKAGMARGGWTRIAALGLVAFLLSSSARSSPSSALADFNQGKQYQAARQWRQAIQYYAAALKDAPTFYYAYKALGTVYYQAGDHRGALAYYDLYLKSAPGDHATRAFAERIRAQLGAARVPAAPAAQPAAEAAPSAKARASLTGGFDVRAFGGAVMDSGSDLAGDFPGANVASCVAGDGGLGLDYGFPLGFVAGLDVMLGPDRSHGLSAGTSSATATISNLAGFINAGWRFAFFNEVVLEPRIGLGIISGELSISGITDTYAGVGFGVWPELRAEVELGTWGLGLSAGYLSSNIPTLTDSNNNQVLRNAALQTGGPSVGFFVVYHFDPLLR